MPCAWTYAHPKKNAQTWVFAQNKTWDQCLRNAVANDEPFFSHMPYSSSGNYSSPGDCVAYDPTKIDKNSDLEAKNEGNTIWACVGPYRTWMSNMNPEALRASTFRERAATAHNARR